MRERWPDTDTPSFFDLKSPKWAIGRPGWRRQHEVGPAASLRTAPGADVRACLLSRRVLAHVVSPDEISPCRTHGAALGAPALHLLCAPARWVQRGGAR